MTTDDMTKECIEMMNKLTEDLFGNGNMKFYGYTQYCGPDGVPHVREFGNVNKMPSAEGVREPLADVSVEGDYIRAVFELPGAEKKDIVLECQPENLIVSVDNGSRKYQKMLELPKEVDLDYTVANYNNGILEVVLKLKEQTVVKKRIEIN